MSHDKSLTPARVDFKKFSSGDIKYHNDTDFSIPLFYGEKPLVIETDFLVNMFGFLKYKNPSGAFTNTSIALKLPLNPKDPLNEFLDRISSEINAFVQSKINDTNLNENERELFRDREYDDCIKYPRYSPDKENENEDTMKTDADSEKESTVDGNNNNNDGEKKIIKKYYNHLRIKVPSNLHKLKVDFFAGGKYTKYPKKTDVANIALPGVPIRVKMEMQPIWFSTSVKEGLTKKKFGYSWKTLAIEVQTFKFNNK